MTKTVNRPSMAQSFALMKLLEAEYASSGMTCAEFAEHAKKIIPSSHPWDAQHIYTRLKELDIPINVPKSPKTELEEIKSVVEILVKEVAELQAEVKELRQGVQHFLPSKPAKATPFRLDLANGEVKP